MLPSQPSFRQVLPAGKPRVRIAKSYMVELDQSAILARNSPHLLKRLCLKRLCLIPGPFLGLCLFWFRGADEHLLKCTALEHSVLQHF